MDRTVPVVVAHRRGSFPHIHHPLRPLHVRSSRKKTSISRHSESETPESESTSTPVLDRSAIGEPSSLQSGHDLFIEEKLETTQEQEIEDDILETQFLLQKP